MKSFNYKLGLVSGTTYMTSGLSLLIVIVLANKLEYQTFGRFILITTAVLLLSDLCDFGTGSDYLLHFQKSSSRNSELTERDFLQKRIGTAIILFPIILFLSSIAFGYQLATIFSLLIVTTFLRNSVAVIFRTNENYEHFLVLLVGEKVLFLAFIFFSHSSLHILLLESLISIALPIFLTYPSILRTRPNASLLKILRQYTHARLVGLSSFITNVALIFPLIIQLFAGSVLFSSYILVVKVFSPIPALGAAIALVNVSSKQVLSWKPKSVPMVFVTSLVCLISVAFFAAPLIERFTSGKFAYSKLNIITVSIIAVLYFFLNIMVSLKLKKVQLGLIIKGYFLFILTFSILIAATRPLLNLEIILLCELAAISITMLYFSRKRG
jgi:hypothetical protein